MIGALPASQEGTMRPDVIVPPLIPAAPAVAIAPTDAEPAAGQCLLCGQRLDPEPDGSEPVCTDCRAEATKTKRRDPRC